MRRDGKSRMRGEIEGDSKRREKGDIEDERGRERRDGETVRVVGETARREGDTE